jgi:type I restriction enzyme S subunit
VGDVLKLEYGKPLPESQRTTDDGVPAYGANGVLCWSRKAFRTKPSIIVGRKGSAGEVNLAEGPFWPTDVTYFVEHDETASDLKYLFYGLKQLNLPKLAKGVKPGINRNDVYALGILVPPPSRAKAHRRDSR